MNYIGHLVIEDESFDLFAETIIIRNDEVAFVLSGSDPDDGKFTIEGVASKTEHGFYMASHLDVDYKQYSTKDVASIKFTSIEKSSDQGKCIVEGVWIQDGEHWEFSGELNEKNNNRKSIAKKKKYQRRKQE